MTYTQQIIQDAIEGGFRKNQYNEHEIKEIITHAENFTIWFLDPLFWQAVGKTRGWNKKDGSEARIFRKYYIAQSDVEMEGSHETITFWQYKQFRFLDHLAEGDDYETALSKLV